MSCNNSSKILQKIQQKPVTFMCLMRRVHTIYRKFNDCSLASLENVCYSQFAIICKLKSFILQSRVLFISRNKLLINCIDGMAHPLGQFYLHTTVHKAQWTFVFKLLGISIQHNAYVNGCMHRLYKIYDRL